jgi:hypothetical protein
LAQKSNPRRAIKTAAIFVCGLILTFDAGYHSHWRRMSLVSSNPTSRNVEYLLGVGLMLVSGWFGASHADDGDDGPRNVTPS